MLLNADWQQWNQLGDRMLHAYVTSNRRLVVRELEDTDFFVTRASVPINDLEAQTSGITITMFEPEGNERVLWFKCRRTPREVLFNGKMLNVIQQQGIYKVSFPEYYKIAKLQVRF